MNPVRKIAGYGWRPSLPDHRDRVAERTGAAVPSKVDLRTDLRMPPIWDQGDIGSCTAHGSLRAMMFETGAPMLSRLQIYGESRKAEGTFKEDSGCEIRDVVKVLAKAGAAPEPEWPYDVSKFAKAWPAKATKDAKAHLIGSYLSVPQQRAAMQEQLAAGHPVIVGFTVYESFESDAVAKSGVVPLPAKAEKVLGGHCVCVVGYDDFLQQYLCANSWGSSWGQGGYFQMPYAYLENTRLAADFWTVRK